MVWSTIYNINWMDCTMLKKIVPMPDSKIHLFGLLFPTLALFLAPNHDSSLITIIILAIHVIANYNFSATASKLLKIGPIFGDLLTLQQPSSLYIHRSCEYTHNRKRKKNYFKVFDESEVKFHFMTFIWLKLFICYNYVI